MQGSSAMQYRCDQASIGAPELRHDQWELRLDKAEPTVEGWLRVPAAIGRADCVLAYTNPDGSTRYELRLESEVGHPDSVRSFAGVPLTNDHPSRHLDPDSAQLHSVGSVSGPRYNAAAKLVEADLLITQARAIADAKAGKTKLSPGYMIEPDYTPGVWQGQRYDLIQRRPRGNHVAMCDAPRQGPQVAMRLDSAAHTIEGNTMDEVEIEIHGVKVKVRKDEAEKLKAAAAATNPEGVPTLAELAARLKALEGEKGAPAPAPTATPPVVAPPAPAPVPAPQPAAGTPPAATPPAPAPTPAAQNDSATAAQLAAAEARHKVELEAARAEAQGRVDASEQRADTIAEARGIMGVALVVTRKDDKGADVRKSVRELRLDVVKHVLGDEVHKDVAGRDDNYVLAFYDQAKKAAASKRSHAKDLVHAADAAGQGGTRKDTAADAKAAADKKRQNGWKPEQPAAK